MAKGGYRPGAGRKKGGRDKPHILDYWTPQEVVEFFEHIKKQYKSNDRIAVWVGEQISGKAVQPVSGENGEPIAIVFDNAFAPKTKGSSK